MKFVSAILVALAVVGPLNAYKIPATGDGVLAKELQDFLDLIPLQKVEELCREYLAQDREYQVVMSVMRSNDVKQLLQEVEAAPEFKELIDYVQSRGVDVYYMINTVNKALDLAPVTPLVASNYKITGGINGFEIDFMNLVQLDKLFDLYEIKVESSPAFNDYINEVTSVKYLQFYSSIASNKHLKQIQQKVAQKGVILENFNSVFFVFFVLSFIGA